MLYETQKFSVVTLLHDTEGYLGLRMSVVEVHLSNSPETNRFCVSAFSRTTLQLVSLTSPVLGSTPSQCLTCDFMDCRRNNVNSGLRFVSSTWHEKFQAHENCRKTAPKHPPNPKPVGYSLDTERSMPCMWYNQADAAPAPCRCSRHLSCVLVGGNVEVTWNCKKLVLEWNVASKTFTTVHAFKSIHIVMAFTLAAQWRQDLGVHPHPTSVCMFDCASMNV